MTSLRFTIAAALLALAACSTNAPPPPPPAAPIAPVKKSMAPYIWTHGHAPKAHEAMVPTFGKSLLKPGEYVWAAAIPATGDPRVVVDLNRPMAFVSRA